jgi:hypothetical protein
MTGKVCFKCKEKKDVEEFYRHAKMTDGRLGKCKDCTRDDVRKYRKENDSVREYDRRRYHENPERRQKIYDGIARRNKSHPEKRAAHQAVSNAVRDGRLHKPDKCSHCNVKNKRIEGHHEDYLRPLEVIWVCTLCHRRHYP